jgi:hypothetical protein
MQLSLSTTAAAATGVITLHHASAQTNKKISFFFS